MITLTQREKLLLKVLLAVVIVIAAYYLIVVPLIRIMGNSEDDTKKYRDDLVKLEKIYNQYRDIQQKKTAYVTMLEKRNENTTSLIEQLANSTGISRNIAYTRSSQSSIQNKYVRITVDIKIEGVAIQQFLKFLYQVENTDNLIKVSYLRINPALKGTNTYDVNLKVDNYIFK